MLITTLPRRVARRTLAGAVALIAFFAAMLMGPLAASAHDQLVESTPASNATVETAPDVATLVFSGNIQQIGTELVLSNADKQRFELQPPSIEVTTLKQPLPELPKGEYVLAWRVVSEDGHPISGAIPFTVSKGVEGAAVQQAVADTTAPTAGAGSSDEAGSSAESEASEGAERIADEEVAAANTGWVMWAIAGVAIIVGVVVLLVTFGRRQKRGNK